MNYCVDILMKAKISINLKIMQHQKRFNTSLKIVPVMIISFYEVLFIVLSYIKRI